MARSGFTLIELLVVVTIIILVSVVALPVIIPAISHRQVSEGARIVQGALVGARDAAIRDNSPSGVRLLPDPAQANAYNRIIPLMTPPSYSEGLVNSFPGQFYTAAVTLGTAGPLVLEEAPTTPSGVLNQPTTWYWNVRIGDKIQINNAGPLYTVMGPMVTANAEGFTNYGLPGTATPLGHEYLLLMNGKDDNQDGMIDLAWNGLDDDGDGLIDNATEWLFSYQVTPPGYTYADPMNPGQYVSVGDAPYTPSPEQESWLGRAAVQSVYTITRRPVPGVNARETALPTNVVIDASRSRIQVNPLTSQVDIIVKPDGSMWPALLYSTPASVPLGGSFFQLWLAERSDMGTFQQIKLAPAPPTWVQATPIGQWWLLSVNAKTGNITSLEQPDLVTGYATAMQN